MSQITTAELASIVGCTKRQVQRMIAIGEVPDAERTEGGHWRLVDSKELRNWMSKTAKKIKRKRSMQDERFQHKERREKLVAQMQKTMPACLRGGLVDHRAVLERRLDRQIRSMTKTLDDLASLDLVDLSFPSYRIPALVEALKNYSESWERADGAV